jgi:hypothetical protein
MLQLVEGPDDYQTLPDLNWFRIATRKSLQPIARQWLDAAPKFLDQHRRIVPRTTYDFQFERLASRPAYDHKLAISVLLEKLFVRSNPI